MTLLFSSILRLHALHEAAVPAAHGRLAHAAFLDLIRQADPTVAEQLHNTNGRKPFTASPLSGFRRSAATEGALHLRVGDEGWLRVTLAGDDYFRLFVQRFMQIGGTPQITIGAATFAVSAIETSPTAHPWAGFTPLETLLTDAQPNPHLAFELVTPTAFSMGHNQVELWPRPDLVFGGLARKWVEWGGEPLALPPRDQLLELLRTSDLRLMRTRWRYEARVQLGVTGFIAYRAFDVPPETLKVLNALADFVFYAGLGQKTTQGLGQARRLEGK